MEVAVTLRLCAWWCRGLVVDFTEGLLEGRMVVSQTRWPHLLSCSEPTPYRRQQGLQCYTYVVLWQSTPQDIGSVACPYMKNLRRVVMLKAYEALNMTHPSSVL